MSIFIETQMNETLPSAKRQWRGEAIGGLAGALFVMPATLGCGLVVFQPLGSGFQALGIQAAFGATIVAALFRGLTGGRALQINAPRATQAALLGGLLVQATQWSATTGQPVPATIMPAIVFLALAVAGLSQLLLGALRLGDVLTFIPQPVIAGVVNGFALVILLQQLPLLLGLPDGTGLKALALGTAAVNPWALALGLGAAAGAWVIGDRWTAVPAPLAGLAAGTLAYWILANGMGDAAPLGATVMAPTPGLPFALSAPAVIDLMGHPVFQAMAPSIAVTGLALGVVSSVQSLLSAVAADSLLQHRHDSRRELLTQGGANLLAAVISGTVTGGSPLYTRVAVRNGARTDRANLFVGLGLLAAVLGSGPLLEAVPVSVMAGMVIVAVLRPDDWTLRLVGRLRGRSAGNARDALVQNLAIVVIVAGLVATMDALLALAVGLALGVIIHLRRAAASVLRRSYRADQVHSQTSRPPADMAALKAHGSAIAVMEAHGPIFFGSAESLARRAEHLAAGCETLILDLSRVNDVESTGALVLRQLDERLKRSGVTLLLAGVWKGSGLRTLLRDQGFTAPEVEDRLHGDLETALALAEDRLLARLSGGHRNEEELPLSDHPSLRGLTRAQFDLLTLTARRVTYAPGDRILTQGDTDNSQFLLVKGCVRVEHRRQEAGQAVRIGSIRSGAIFGEMALLTGEPRSADVVADSAVVCHMLTAGDLAMLDSLDPAISFILLRNIATEITLKVRRMSRTASLSDA